MYLSPKQCKITYSPGRFRNDYTQMQEVEYKTNWKKPTPPTAYWAGNQFWRGFWFSETEGKAHWQILGNCQKRGKKKYQQTVKVTVWQPTGQGGRAAATAIARWDSAESGRLAGQWTKEYRWQRFIKMLLYCQKLARRRGIKFSDVQYSNFKKTYLTFWFVRSLPML